MASAPTTPTEELVEVTVSLPADVLREIDRVAAEMKLTRGDLLTGSARRYLFSEQRWREAQAVFAEAAREAGFRTEDDVEDYLDSLPDPQR
jgi:predicted transcriptional regulator